MRFHSAAKRTFRILLTIIQIIVSWLKKYNRILQKNNSGCIESQAQFRIIGIVFYQILSMYGKKSSKIPKEILKKNMLLGSGVFFRWMKTLDNSQQLQKNEWSILIYCNEQPTKYAVVAYCIKCRDIGMHFFINDQIPCYENPIEIKNK
jgi:hypothetical protein